MNVVTCACDTLDAFRPKQTAPVALKGVNHRFKSSEFKEFELRSGRQSHRHGEWNFHVDALKAMPLNAHGPLRRVFRLVYLEYPACYDSRPLLRQQIVMQSILAEETRKCRAYHCPVCP